MNGKKSLILKDTHLKTVVDTLLFMRSKEPVDPSLQMFLLSPFASIFILTPTDGLNPYIYFLNYK